MPLRGSFFAPHRLLRGHLSPHAGRGARFNISSLNQISTNTAPKGREEMLPRVQRAAQRHAKPVESTAQSRSDKQGKQIASLCVLCDSVVNPAYPPCKNTKTSAHAEVLVYFHSVSLAPRFSHAEPLSLFSLFL